MSGIVESGPEGGHGNADANDTAKTLFRHWSLGPALEKAYAQVGHIGQVIE
jgi:hypothetical protein